MKYHELCTLFPAIEGAPMDLLVADIKANGLREPITTLNGEILDGRNRFEACKLAGVEPAFQEFQGGDEVAFVMSKNLSRRHLSDSQRAMIAAELSNVSWGGNRQGATAHLETNQVTTQEAADIMKVSQRSTKTARAVKKKSPEVADMVKEGKVSLNAANKATQSSATKLKNAVAKGPDAVKKLAEEQPSRKIQSVTLGSEAHANIYASAPAPIIPDVNEPFEPRGVNNAPAPTPGGFDTTTPAGQAAVRWVVRELEQFCTANKPKWNTPPPPLPSDIVKAIKSHFLDYMDE